MLIGILSDSHGRHEPVRKAAKLFGELGCERVFHCGDVGGIPVFEELLDRPLHFVWGNTDMPASCDLAFLEKADVPAPSEVPVLAELAGKRIALFHGHEREFYRAVTDYDADYVLHGHTHEKRDERIGGVRVINPGALHRARQRTVATLDLATDTLQFHTITV